MTTASIVLAITVGLLLLLLLAGMLIWAYRLESSVATPERLKELELLRLTYSQLSECDGDDCSQMSAYYLSEISRLSRTRLD